MEVVHEGVIASGSNVEYEMNQDGAEEDHAMEYTAQAHQEHEGGDGEHVYEVTMEEYGHDGGEEGEMQDAPLEEYADEEDIMNDAGTHAEEGEGEEEEEQYNEGEDAETGNDDDEQQAGGAEGEAAVGEVEVVSEVPAERESKAEAIVHKIEEGESSTSVSLRQNDGETTEVIEQVRVDIPRDDTDEAYEPVEDGTAHGETEAAAEAEEEILGEHEQDGSDEVHSPPAIRVTYNGQDFVLFPHSEPSAYISAQQAEPIAAPRLKAEEQVYFESMESLFQTLRVKESLGDFLEEGSELQVQFVDLDLTLREDDIYSREISLNDIHRIHLGYGLTSSLHLVISEVTRFITRYNELAGHISDAAEEGKGNQVEAVENETAVAADEEQNKGENEHTSEPGELKEGIESSQVESKEEENVALQAGEEEEQAQDEAYETNSTSTTRLTIVQADETSGAGETTFITVNEDQVEELASPDKSGEVEAEEEEEEDIVDYDEAYQGEQIEEGGEEIHEETGDDYAEYEGDIQEDEGKEEEGESESKGTYEENGDGEGTNGYTVGDGDEGHYEGEEVEKIDQGHLMQTRQKRSHGEDETRSEKKEPIASIDYEESESKRVKIDDH